MATRPGPCAALPASGTDWEIPQLCRCLYVLGTVRMYSTYVLAYPYAGSKVDRCGRTAQLSPTALLQSRAGLMEDCNMAIRPTSVRSETAKQTGSGSGSGFLLNSESDGPSCCLLIRRNPRRLLKPKVPSARRFLRIIRPC